MHDRRAACLPAGFRRAAALAMLVILPALAPRPARAQGAPGDSIPPAPASRLPDLQAAPGDSIPPATARLPDLRGTPGDSLRWRFELGGSTDITNEIYFEDAFIDTAFLGRQQITSPEIRWAGVGYVGLSGTRAAGTTRYDFSDEVSVGNLLSRETAWLSWRADFAPDWRLVIGPNFDYRHDRTLDRDMNEWHGSMFARVRRDFTEDASALELGARGDVLRADGPGSEFVLDRNAAGGDLAFESFPAASPDWRVGYHFTAREFPDSTERDHYEHAWEARFHSDRARGFGWSIETSGERRVTMRPAPTSRDNFWDERANATLDALNPDRWSLRAELDGEAIQYDVQDSTLFFNYQVVRAVVGPRLSGGAWSLWIAPRAEALFSQLDPGEGYLETGGQVEFEYLGARAWWNVTPAAGWRQYANDPRAIEEGLGELHSSFAFYELTLFGDQALPARLRLRTMITARWEPHTDDVQNAGSLYFSVDVRRLF